jgi:hypothetical protein
MNGLTWASVFYLVMSFSFLFPVSLFFGLCFRVCVFCKIVTHYCFVQTLFPLVQNTRAYGKNGVFEANTATAFFRFLTTYPQ